MECVKRWKTTLRVIATLDEDGTMTCDAVFTTRSRFKRRIYLTKATWLDKILKDHPELSI